MIMSGGFFEFFNHGLQSLVNISTMTTVLRLDCTTVFILVVSIDRSFYSIEFDHFNKIIRRKYLAV